MLNIKNSNKTKGGGALHKVMQLLAKLAVRFLSASIVSVLAPKRQIVAKNKLFQKMQEMIFIHIFVLN